MNIPHRPVYGAETELFVPSELVRDAELVVASELVGYGLAGCVRRVAVVALPDLIRVQLCRCYGIVTELAGAEAEFGVAVHGSGRNDNWREQWEQQEMRSCLGEQEHRCRQSMDGPRQRER